VTDHFFVWNGTEFGGSGYALEALNLPPARPCASASYSRTQPPGYGLEKRNEWRLGRRRNIRLVRDFLTACLEDTK
jgi:hypothetical protein